MNADEKKREIAFHLWGWILFIICAGFFIASSAKDGNMLGLIGSIIFFIACVFFIIPLVIRKNRETGD